MTQGTSDYSNPEYLTGSVNDDNSVLLAATLGITPLGGPAKFLLMETFRSGSQSLLLSSSLGSWPSLGYVFSEVGPVSLTFPTNSTYPVRESSASRSWFVSVPNRFGFEVSVSSAPSTGYFLLKLSYSLGFDRCDGWVKFDFSAGEVLYWNGSSYVAIPDVFVSSQLGVWLPVKIVVDFVERVYHRVYVGDNVVEMVDPVHSYTAGIASNFITATVQYFPSAALPVGLFVGHFFVTSDEP